MNISIEEYESKLSEAKSRLDKIVKDCKKNNNYEINTEEINNTLKKIENLQYKLNHLKQIRKEE